VVKRRDFVINMNVNLSTVKNQITKMPPTVKEFITTTGNKKYTEGASVFEFWLRSFYGVDPSDGSALYEAQNTAATAGRRIIANKNGTMDTVTTLVSNAKFEYHGTSIPDLYGSVNPTITFKQFSLSAILTFQLGGRVYDDNYQSLMSVAGYGAAKHVDILRRWQKPGDITDVPRMDAGRATDFNANSSRWLIDGSFLNVRTLTMSYSFTKLLSTTGQFFVSGENLGFMSRRKGMNAQQAFSGVTSNAYPPARIITAGLTLNL
jgi:hypothetical protein